MTFASYVAVAIIFYLMGRGDGSGPSGLVFYNTEGAHDGE